MKKIITLVFLTFLVISAFSQTKDEVNYIQSIWGMEKRDIVKSHMNLTDDESKDFWAVYDKYEDSRKELGKERINTILDYGQNVKELTGEKAEELILKMLSNQNKVLELQNTVYNQMKAVIPQVKAAQFVQLENYLDTVLKLKVMEEIPLIGEKKK